MQTSPPPCFLQLTQLAGPCLIPSDQKKYPQKHNRAHQISGANEVEWCEDEEQRQDIENASPGRQDGGSGQNRSEGSRQHRKTPSMMDAMGFFNGAPSNNREGVRSCEHDSFFWQKICLSLNSSILSPKTGKRRTFQGPALSFSGFIFLHFFSRVLCPELPCRKGPAGTAELLYLWYRRSSVRWPVCCFRSCCHFHWWSLKLR